ncbi:hypothetical protein LWC34_29920 [Kibdelosporangium philippinense]|uniref:Uncharacterized protein n=1 Tax=Kibdelosporangium philippinense TaxID=211113 RepID=A0ABS8ZK56_9PSEU|nr:hypothetical protein [Kibdelosporangium philippinense]MCE7007016.1 hypothetical protein [Kibdelosporangium philippinense]
MLTLASPQQRAGAEATQQVLLVRYADHEQSDMPNHGHGMFGVALVVATRQRGGNRRIQFDGGV